MKSVVGRVRAEAVELLFDLLYLDGDAIGPAPLRDRKGRLQELLASVPAPLQYSDHQLGRGPEFYARACEMGLEGIVSKRADAPYVPGNRGLWVKTKCLHRRQPRSAGRCRHKGLDPKFNSTRASFGR